MQIQGRWRPLVAGLRGRPRQRTADGLEPAATIFVAAMLVLAASLNLLALTRATRPTEREALLAAVFAGCMALAWLFPLHFAFKTTLYVDTAVTVAVILLFAPAVAMLVAGGGTLLAHGLRRANRDWMQALFNAAQAMLLAATGALLLAAAGWDPAHPSFGRPWVVPVVLVAGVAMHLLSVLAVATIVALQERLPVVESWRRALLEDPRVELLAQLSLLAIGVLAAMVVAAHPWGLALLAAPVVAAHGTLRHQARLRQELEARVTAITETQRIAGELVDARRRLAASREDERLRLARDLHDGPVQDLLAISYQLAGHRPSLAAPRPGPQPLSTEETMRQEVLDVVRQLRGLVGELRPAGLAEFGLPAALEGYVAGLQRHAGAPLPTIDLDLGGVPADLPPPLALSLFRIAQEALRNALRHADARRVTVTLGEQDGGMVLRVRDDGCGFAVPPRLHAFAAAGHFGLVGIAERADQADGELSVASAATAGTTITARLPLTIPSDRHA